MQILGEVVFTECNNSDSVHFTPPEEQAEGKRKYQFRIANNAAFLQKKAQRRKRCKKIKKTTKKK